MAQTRASLLYAIDLASRLGFWDDVAEHKAELKELEELEGK